MHMIDAHSHAHLLRVAGVSWPDAIVCCGAQPSDWQQVSRWCGGHGGARAMYGVHPWFVGQYAADTLARLREWLAADPATGVGEIGLHYGRSCGNRAQQLVCFREQLRLGCTLQRSIAIHCVGAWGPLLECLDACDHTQARILVHAYNGSLEMARELVRRGVFLSLQLSATGARPARLAAALDGSFLLVESDAGGQPEADTYDGGVLVRRIEQLAQWRGETVAALAAQVYANSLRFLQPS